MCIGHIRYITIDDDSRCVTEGTAFILIEHAVANFSMEFSTGTHGYPNVQYRCRVCFDKYISMAHFGIRSIFIKYYILQIVSVGSSTNNKKKDLIEHIYTSTEELLCNQIKSMLNLSDEYVRAKVKRNLQLVIKTNYETTVLNIEKLIARSDRILVDDKFNETNIRRNDLLPTPTLPKIVRNGHPAETLRTPESTSRSSLKYENSSDTSSTLSRHYDTSFDEEDIYKIQRKKLKVAIESSEHLVVIIHGWNSHSNERSTMTIAAELLQKPRVLVVALECGQLLSADYFTATRYVNAIGEEFGASLAHITGGILDPSKIYLIGHSLGAHIASVAGKAFKNLTGSELGRITALDPAKPCYTNLNHGLRKGDAIFVDVIHTNAGFLGIKEAIGDADFYPNGGSMQPGCFLLSMSCYHLKSWEFFAQSVNKEKFIAVECPSWAAYTHGQCAGNSRAEMGYHCSAAAGTYFLATPEAAVVAAAHRTVHP